MNTLDGLIPHIYTGLETVSRELYGMINAVNRDAKAESGALNQIVRSPIAGESALEDIIPGEHPQPSGDANHTYYDMALTKSKVYPIRWTGEEQVALSRNEAYGKLLANQFAKGFRAIAREVEADLGSLLLQSGQMIRPESGVLFGDQGSFKDFAHINRELDVAGAPETDRHLVMSAEARARLEANNPMIITANTAGTDAVLRNRQNLPILGLNVGMSGGMLRSTLSGANSYKVDKTGGYAAGTKVIKVKEGVEDIQPGMAFYLKNGLYIAMNTVTGGAGDLELNRPLIENISNQKQLYAIGAYQMSGAFTQDAFLLAARTPAMPAGGDNADDVTVVTDPLSGISYQVALYRQYRQTKIEIGLTWGVGAPNGKHAVSILDSI